MDDIFGGLNWLHIVEVSLGYLAAKLGLGASTKGARKVAAAVIARKIQSQFSGKTQPGGRR